MFIFSIFTLPKNSEEFDRGVYLTKFQKIITLIFYYIFPSSIVYLVMVPLSLIPYPFDWYLIVIIFFGSLFLNGFYLWAKGGVFFLFCWLLNIVSFRYLPFVLSLILPVQVATVNSSLSELIDFKGRVLFVQDMPIQKSSITKNSFTIRTNYLFPVRQPTGVLRNYEDSDYEFQVAPIFPPEDLEKIPKMIAYANDWEDWNFPSSYYLIPVHFNLVWGNYLKNKIYIQQLQETDLYVGYPVESLFWPRFFSILFIFVLPISSIFLALKIHPSMFDTKVQAL